MNQSALVLAIDDERPCLFADVLCRTAEAGIKAIQTMGPFDAIFLDHDLCALKTQHDDRGIELTGYSVILFLEEHPEFMPQEIHLLTNNGSGRDKMVLALDHMMDRRFGHWEKRNATPRQETFES